MQLKPLFAVIIGLSTTSAASAANYRVENQVWGDYQMNGSVTSPLLGSLPFNINRNLDHDYSYNSGNTAGTVPAAAEFNRTFNGDATIGAGDIHVSTYAQTDWGLNHAGVKIEGFSKAEKTVVAYPQITTTNPDFMGMGGMYSSPDTKNPITINTSTNAYSNASSRWEELYQISGGTGTGTAHISMHVDGFLDGALANNDNASINYNLSTFNGEQILGLYAYTSFYPDWVYDPTSGTYNRADTQHWSESILQNGVWSYSSGTGSLPSINEMLQGDYTFTYGDPLYLNSYLDAYVNGNGESNFKNTVTMESLILPENASVYALSGANPAAYHIAFSGNGGGTVCATLDCVNGGLGGGGISQVPVPASIWMFGSTLAGLLGITRRRQLASF